MRRHEWLLDIDFRKRELFAYACEAYSRILAVVETRQRRLDALARHADGALPGDETIEIGEYLDLLAAAVVPVVCFDPSVFASEVSTQVRTPAA